MTKFLYFAFILFLLTFLWEGCGKDNDGDVITPPTVKSSLVVNITPLAVNNQVLVNYKDKVTTTWLSLNLVSLEVNGTAMSNTVVYINGVKQPTIDEGFVELPPVTQDTAVKFYGVGKDGKIYDFIYTIKVGPKPAPNRTDTLCNNYWMFSKDSRQFYDGAWLFTKWTADELKYKFYFSSDGSTYTYSPITNQKTKGLNWSWYGDSSIKIGNDILPCLLSKNKFITYLKDGTIETHYDGYPLNP